MAAGIRSGSTLDRIDIARCRFSESVNKRSSEINEAQTVGHSSQWIDITDLISNAAGSAGRLPITGGGSKNLFLINTLRFRMLCQIVVPDGQFIDFKEALIFALPGVLSFNGEINAQGTVTGARRDHIGGIIYTFKITDIIH